MIFVEINKNKKLESLKIKKDIISMLFDKFLNCLNYTPKNTI